MLAFAASLAARRRHESTGDRRGRLTLEAVEAMHDKIRSTSRSPTSCCARTTAPTDARAANRWRECSSKVQRRHAIDSRRSVMVGDRWTDIEAGQSVGCRTVLVGPGYDEPPVSTEPDRRAAELLARHPALKHFSQDEPLRTDGMNHGLRQDLRRRRRHRGDSQAGCRPEHPGLHDQPDVDAKGRSHRLRGLQPRGPRTDRRPSDQLRGVRRRRPDSSRSRLGSSRRGVTTST